MAEKSLVNDVAVMLTVVVPPDVVAVVDSSSESLPQAARIITAAPMLSARTADRFRRKFTRTPLSSSRSRESATIRQG